MDDFLSLNGVVLAGGRSTRMGKDKFLLKKDQLYFYEHSATVLSYHCKKVYVSVNKDQLFQHFFKLPLIVDKFSDQGPLSGILSSIETLNSTVLFSACDLPYVGQADIDALLHLRDEQQIVTTFYNTERKAYEPLLSIWEKSSIPFLRNYFDGGQRSVQHFLMENNIPKHNAPDIRRFKNITYETDWPD